MRLFPYHLGDYLCRVMRVSPFKYYCEMVLALMREEKSYASLPNFTAADILRVLGIGRNEYISIMNACKGSRNALWRGVGLGGKLGVSRDLLPAEPLHVRMEGWWHVMVVNLAEQEFRELDEAALANLKTANLPGGATLVRDLDPVVLRSLHARGLVYLHVPISPEDRLSIPPLEGFVSNKTSDSSDSTADPVESLLYSCFVASSERLRVGDLAAILAVPLAELCATMSVAVRLGFATRIAGEEAGAPGRSVTPGPRLPTSDTDMIDMGEEEEGETSQSHQAVAAAQGQAVAVVVDAEATSYLMMGALSPGLKRHSVTLFEGGRVGGEDIISELISELWTSHAAGQEFEGDMLQLTSYAAALATVLEAVRSSGQGRPVELLRKESLAGLTPLAACKVLSHAYCAVVPITPLPFPPLPLHPMTRGPAYFGPTLEAASPWMQLALYSAARSGPLSLVFTAGQRVCRLPTHLEGCTHALMWPWEPDTEPARASKGIASDGCVTLVEASFLLYALNELLTRTAVMLQPLTCVHIGGGGGAGGGSSGGTVGGGGDAGLLVVDIPLPLEQRGGAKACIVTGVERRRGASMDVQLDPGVRQALLSLGLSHSLGFMRVVQLPHAAPTHSSSSSTTHNPSSSHQDQHHQQRQQHRRGGSSSRENPGSTTSPSKPLPGLVGGSLSRTSSAVPAGEGAHDRSSTTEGTEEHHRPMAGRPGVPWVPLSLQLGVPLYCLDLCKAVCGRAVSEHFLSPDGRAAQAEGQLILQHALHSLSSLYSADRPAEGADEGDSQFDPNDVRSGMSSLSLRGGWGLMPGLSLEAGFVPGRVPELGASTLELPACNLLFDGMHLTPVDLDDCIQGVGCSYRG
ncbi:MAG: hypothetical protein WDW38_008689 [Sanguina aurantia]